MIILVNKINTYIHFYYKELLILVIIVFNQFFKQNKRIKNLNAFV